MTQTAMRERPILFSSEMIRAILGGRKTQTRRVVKPQPSFPFGVREIVLVPDPWHNEAFEGTPAAGMGRTGPRQLQWHCEDFAGNLVAAWQGKSVYGQPGDLLWAREAWGWQTRGGGPQDDEPESRDLVYRADHPTLVLDRWHPSIHMPRAASRITLELTDVRVQRVQDISEDEARAEGVAPEPWPEDTTADDDALNAECGYFPPRSDAAGFARLWDDLNEKRGYSYESNPWVWALTFKRIESTTPETL